MKNFLKDLGISIFTSIVIVPCVLIGLGAGETIWEKKVEPYLKKKLGD